MTSDQTKERGGGYVDNAVRAYQQLDVYLERAMAGKTEAIEMAQQQLAATSVAVGGIESFVREVLQVPTV